jgi:hypothetical protein
MLGECLPANYRFWSVAIDPGMRQLWLVELLACMWRGWCVAMWCNRSSTSAEKLVLGPHLLLLSLEG